MLETFHIQDYARYKYQYYKSYFPLNNKLYKYFQKSCKKLFDYLAIQNKNHIIFAFKIITNLGIISNNIKKKFKINFNYIYIYYLYINKYFSKYNHQLQFLQISLF